MGPQGPIRAGYGADGADKGRIWGRIPDMGPVISIYIRAPPPKGRVWISRGGGGGDPRVQGWRSRRFPAPRVRRVWISERQLFYIILTSRPPLAENFKNTKESLYKHACLPACMHACRRSCMQSCKCVCMYEACKHACKHFICFQIRPFNYE